MVDYREKYIASQAPRKKRTHPARSAQALATSGAGIVHREMMDLQRQPELNKAETDRLKELRSDWNRNRKYTDAGMALAGVTTPQEAQDAFMRSTEDFRQLNKPAYNQMYPLTSGFMNYADKGGLLGMFLSGFARKTKKNIMDYGKDLLEKKGILGTVDSSPQDQVEYAANTFGYPYNVHKDESTDTEIDALAPDIQTPEEQIQSFIDEKQRKVDNFETNAYSDILDDAIESHWGTQKEQDDYYGKSEQGEMVFADVPEEWNVMDVVGPDEPLSFDEGREDYINRQNEYIAAPTGTINPNNPPKPPNPHFPFYPYPGYDTSVRDLGELEPLPTDADFGRGNLSYDFDYDKMRKGYEDAEYWNNIFEDHPMNLKSKTSVPETMTEEIQSKPDKEWIRELAIQRNMSPYSRDYEPPLKFPPIGPHDPFDPNQRVFENDKEYREWLSRKRLGA